jgi:hypothetical protein
MTFSFARSWGQEGWPIAVTQGPLTPPNVVHTATGETITLVGGRGKVFAVGVDLLPVVLWDSFQQVVNAPAAIPIDGMMEGVVAMSAEGGRLALMALRGPDAGGPLPGWPVAPTGRALSTPVLADLDGDGSPEVAVGSADGRACLLNMAGVMSPGWPIVLADGPVGAPAVADVDGDGSKDLVFCGQGVFALSSSGEPLPGWPVMHDETRLSEPLVADLEGDGVVETVVGSATHIWVLAPDGRPCPGWPVEPGASLSLPLVICDVDGDGVLDIGASDTYGGIWAWSSAGDPIADCTGVRNGDETAPTHAVLCFDADGDDRGEFMSVSGRGVDLRRPPRRSMEGWPLAVPALTGGVLADLDGDGDLEAVLSDSVGALHAWDLPYHSGAGWFFSRGTSAMTGWAGSGSPPAATEGLVDSGDFYVWPSPVSGSEAHVSFRARAGALIGLTILDAGGRRRQGWTGTASGQRQDWTFEARMPMGVYLCRLEAGYEGSTRSLVHPFAVLGEE